MASTKKLNRMDLGSRQGMAEQVHEIIRAQIFERQLVAGDRLNIDKLARELGVSATPVREAMNRLVADRLVWYEPYSGYTLAPADDRDGIIKLRSAREVIEVYCATVGAVSATPGLIRDMEACNKDMADALSDYRYASFKAFEKRDNDFHDLIVLSTDNSYLVDAYRPIGTRIRMLRMFYAGGPTDMRAVIKEHKQVLSAYEQRDAKRAAAAVKKHLKAASKRLDLMVDQFVGTAKVAPLGGANKDSTRRGRRH